MTRCCYCGCSCARGTTCNTFYGCGCHGIGGSHVCFEWTPEDQKRVEKLERHAALRFAIEELKRAVPCQRDVEQCHHAKILQRRIAELQKELEEK